VLSSPAVMRLSKARWIRPLEACGKHSLEIFALVTIFAMVGRLSFRTFGADWPMQIAVNGVGIGLIVAAALWMERRRAAARGFVGGRLAGGHGPGCRPVRGPRFDPRHNPNMLAI